MKGLVLAGGEGSRLGMEKAFLNVRGESQLSFITRQFKVLNIEPFVSAPVKKKELFIGHSFISDKQGLSGPIAGIAAAFEKYAGPWVVVGVDMPFMDHNAIQFLLDARKNGVATCFCLDEKNPEPLACVWEVSAGKLFPRYLGKFKDSPSEFLKLNNANLVKPAEAHWPMSINTPEDQELATSILKKV